MFFTIVKNLDCNFFFNQIGKLSIVTSGLYQVVVNPMVITASRFTHQKAVVFETIGF